MNQNTLDKYTKLIKKMEQHNNNGHGGQDTELYHMEQDVIYRKFIKDIATGKITNLEEIVNLSKLLNNKVVKNDKDMWYS